MWEITINMYFLNLVCSYFRPFIVHDGANSSPVEMDLSGIIPRISFIPADFSCTMNS